MLTLPLEDVRRDLTVRARAAASAAGVAITEPALARAVTAFLELAVIASLRGGEVDLGAVVAKIASTLSDELGDVVAELDYVRRQRDHLLGGLSWAMATADNPMAGESSEDEEDFLDALS